MKRGTSYLFRSLWLLLLLPAAFSCRMFHGSGLVARVGKHELYKAELERYIPSGLSSEDSLRMALQYIDVWAKGHIFSDLAEKELSKEQKDVSRELKDYRTALLRYRYEQQFINQRLDTAVTQQEIESYYQEHRETFRLIRPVMKVRFVRISQDSPHLRTILEKMSSSRNEDLVEADSLAYKSALKYTSYGNAWVDAALLAKEFDTDYETLLLKMKDRCIRLPDGKGNLNAAYVFQMTDRGRIGPVEYYEGRIKDIILSARKQKLLTDLERNLTDRANAQGDFVIY